MRFERSAPEMHRFAPLVVAAPHIQLHYRSMAIVPRIRRCIICHHVCTTVDASTVLAEPQHTRLAAARDRCFQPQRIVRRERRQSQCGGMTTTAGALMCVTTGIGIATNICICPCTCTCTCIRTLTLTLTLTRIRIRIRIRICICICMLKHQAL